MTITDTLRHAITRAQVMISTHERLCLRGLVRGEVVRVRKHRTVGVHVETVDRSPSEFRVEQLLTSEFFGLATTIDPEVDRVYSEYSELLLLGAKREPWQETEFLRLKDKVAEPNPVLGRSRDAQLACDVIDEVLAREMKLENASRAPGGRPRPTAEARAVLRQVTVKNVLEIWRGQQTSKHYPRTRASVRPAAARVPRVL